MKQKFTVTGMTCSACSAHVDKAVRKLKGVSEVNVNLLGGSMTVEYDPAAETPEDIIAAVDAAGYGCALPQKAAPGKQDTRADAARQMEEELAGMKRRFIPESSSSICRAASARVSGLPATALWGRAQP